MTKQKALGQLVKIGWRLIDRRPGKSTVELLAPAAMNMSHSFIGDPRDLLAELAEKPI